MIIKKLSLDDSKFTDIEFNDHITIIHGDTDAGKTLIFRMIEQVFGAENALDETAMKSRYPDATALSCTVESGGSEYIFKRYIYSTTTEVYKDGEFFNKYPNLSQFGEFVFSLFSFDHTTKLITNKSLASSSLTLREYTKFLFFSESRLTDEKSFVELQGPGFKRKYLNLFSYLISGISPNADKLSLKSAKDEIKGKKSSIIKYLQEYQTSNSERLLESDNEQNALFSRIEEHRSKVICLENKKKSVESQILSLESELFKLNSMLAYYDEKKTSIELATELLSYLNKYQIICKECGAKHEHSLDVEWGIIREHDALMQVIISKQQLLQKKKNELDEISSKHALAFAELETMETDLANAKKEPGYASISKMIDDLDRDLSTSSISIVELNQISKITERIDDICEEIRQQLIKAGLNKNPAVEFDYDYKVLDFLVDKVKRNVIGKGKRALITTVLLLKTCDISRSDVGFIGFAMIDSLWTTLFFKDQQKRNKAIKSVLNYMEELGIQIILIDNEIPNSITETENIKIIGIK